MSDAILNHVGALVYMGAGIFGVFRAPPGMSGRADPVRTPSAAEIRRRQGHDTWSIHVGAELPQAAAGPEPLPIPGPAM